MNCGKGTSPLLGRGVIFPASITLFRMVCRTGLVFSDCPDNGNSPEWLCKYLGL